MSAARGGFALRLVAAQAIALIAGAVTIWLVASAIGPGIFRDHLARARVHHTMTETDHVEEAFNSSLLISVVVALVASFATALAVSWWLSHRVERTVAAVASAAGDIAAGRYETRVADPGLGTEFGRLSDSYNSLAVRLGTVEDTRRQMLADLAHEMRTPLATIGAHLEAVEDGVREADAGTLDVLRESTHRLLRLAEDIGAISRVEEGGRPLASQSLDAAAVIDSAVSAADERAAAAQVQIAVEVVGTPRVRADPDRLAQVLANLLDNALRHTPPGGLVAVRCATLGDSVELVVRDTGEGVGAQHLEHLFDRFYRVDSARDREHGGSGIGLSIARTLVEAQGGSISVASDGAGHGTSFHVRLPAAT